MLLQITNKTSPATDLSWLLHKRPDRFQDFDTPYGRVHTFYTKADEDECSFVFLLDVDSIELIRGRKDRFYSGQQQHYINDSPYTASSFFSAALLKVLNSALKGKSKENPDLPDKTLNLEAKISVISSEKGEEYIHRLFDPLGYEVKTIPHPLNSLRPEWGKGAYYTLILNAKTKLSTLLTHLYVLCPVLDNKKHYWITKDEVDKLLDRGKGWLENHPERDFIISSYLKHQKSLTSEALQRLMEDEEIDEVVEADDEAGEILEYRISLNRQRVDKIISLLKENEASEFIDLGCGEGKLIKAAIEDPFFKKIAGMDVSCRELEIAAKRLQFDKMPDMKRKRIELFQGSLLYGDNRLKGYKAAVLSEVIEHLEPDRLPDFEKVVFLHANPELVLLTTPNAEYNKKWESLPSKELRHQDHRFEWTREQFKNRAEKIAEVFGYSVTFHSIGDEDPDLGPPTQLALFRKIAASKRGEKE